MFDHWGNTIYWNALSWEAFAALAAIVAAGVVGFRQVGIASRQIKLQALDVRAALWDRRMVIYDTTREFLAHIVLKGRVPGRGSAFARVAGRKAPGGELGVAFSQAVDRGQFLLSSESYTRLVALRNRAERLAEIHEDAGIVYEPDKSRLEAEAKTLRAQIVHDYNHVASIFGDDLTLQDR